MTAVIASSAVTVDFALPPERTARQPPEYRGVARDGVRLLVAEPGRIRHLRFRQLGEVLAPGDLVVVNTSAVVPAAVDAIRADDRQVVLHVSGRRPGGSWIVEVREPDGAAPVLDAAAGEILTLMTGARVRLMAPAALPHRRLWTARFDLDGPVWVELARVGRPIAYGYLDGRYPLADYQSVFARHPGSAEMASAGRPFTGSLVTDLVTRGIAVAPVLLHTGLSSPEVHEPPQQERYDVPETTAALVRHTRRHGGRIIAVGTTVTRALETVARDDGSVTAGAGWTDLLLGPERPARVIDGIVTGWHEPGASHLLVLEAVAGSELTTAAYEAALGGGYLWHEFGDSCLLMPRR